MRELSAAGYERHDLRVRADLRNRDLRPTAAIQLPSPACAVAGRRGDADAGREQAQRSRRRRAGIRPEDEHGRIGQRVAADEAGAVSDRGPAGRHLRRPALVRIVVPDGAGPPAAAAGEDRDEENEGERPHRRELRASRAGANPYLPPMDELSRISRADSDAVEVRGRDLAGDLMGRLTFTEYFHLLVTGREPSEDERFFLDLLLVSIAEHGLMPSNVAARMTLAADPESIQGAVAAGILGAGSVILGAAGECARLLVDARTRGAETVVREIHEEGGRVPGFGHPLHRPVDPRAERILALADERGVSAEYVGLARRLSDAVAAVYPKPLTLNVSLPIAAVLLDLGYGPTMAKAVPILARTAGLLAHLAEEQQHPIGFLLASRAADE